MTRSDLPEPARADRRKGVVIKITPVHNLITAVIYATYSKKCLSEQADSYDRKFILKAG